MQRQEAKFVTYDFPSEVFKRFTPHIRLSLSFEFLRCAKKYNGKHFPRDKKAFGVNQLIEHFVQHTDDKTIVSFLGNKSKSIVDTLPHSAFKSYLYGKAIAMFGREFGCQQLSFTPTNTVVASENVSLVQTLVDNDETIIMLNPVKKEMGLCFAVKKIRRGSDAFVILFDPQKCFYVVYSKSMKSAMIKANALIRDILAYHAKDYPFASFHYFSSKPIKVPRHQVAAIRKSEPKEDISLMKHNLDFELDLLLR